MAKLNKLWSFLWVCFYFVLDPIFQFFCFLHVCKKSMIFTIWTINLLYSYSRMSLIKKKFFEGAIVILLTLKLSYVVSDGSKILSKYNIETLHISLPGTWFFSNTWTIFWTNLVTNSNGIEIVSPILSKSSTMSQM